MHKSERPELSASNIHTYFESAWQIQDITRSMDQQARYGAMVKHLSDHYTLAGPARTAVNASVGVDGVNLRAGDVLPMTADEVVSFRFKERERERLSHMTGQHYDPSDRTHRLAHRVTQLQELQNVDRWARYGWPPLVQGDVFSVFKSKEGLSISWNEEDNLDPSDYILETAAENKKNHKMFNRTKLKLGSLALGGALSTEVVDGYADMPGLLQLALISGGAGVAYLKNRKNRRQALKAEERSMSTLAKEVHGSVLSIIENASEGRHGLLIPDVGNGPSRVELDDEFLEHRMTTSSGFELSNAGALDVLSTCGGNSTRKKQWRPIFEAYVEVVSSSEEDNSNVMIFDAESADAEDPKRLELIEFDPVQELEQLVRTSSDPESFIESSLESLMNLREAILHKHDLQEAFEYADQNLTALGAKRSELEMMRQSHAKYELKSLMGIAASWLEVEYRNLSGII